MEDLASMCERQCSKACNLCSAAEELEETGSNGRARRYRKRGSPKPAVEARAMETDPSPVRLWSAADSEGHSDGYRTAFPSDLEEMAILPTRAHTAPESSLEHDAEALERPARARTVKPVGTPVAILGSLGVCIYVPASRHWLISYSPFHLT